MISSLALSFLLAIASTTGSVPLEEDGPNADVLPGYWRGALVRDGSLLFLDLRVTREGDELRGAVSVEEWGLLDAPVSITRSGNTVTTSLLGLPLSLHLDAESAEMVGLVPLDGEMLRLHWKRSPEVPPRVFREEEVAFTSREARLAGSVILPQGEGPFPGVVLVAGRSYGARTGMLPFAALLARRGIASLAFDGRGRGRSEGDPLAMTDRDRIADVHAAFEALVSRPDVRRDRVGLLGESTGGWIVPIVAQELPEVAFLVLVVGPAEDLVEQQAHVVRYRMLASDTPYDEAELNAAEDYQRRLTAHLVRHGTYEEWRPELERARDERWAEWVTIPESFAPEDFAFYWNQPYDSTAALRKTTAPLLALYGGSDFVVPPEVNVPKLRALLTEAGNPDFAIHVFPGADHSVFLPAGYRGEGEFPQRYWRWNRPAPGYYDTLAGWVVEHAR